MKEKHREESYICTINITVTTLIFQAAAEDLFQGHQSGEKQKDIPTIYSLNGILSEIQKLKGIFNSIFCLSYGL